MGLDPIPGFNAQHFPQATVTSCACCPPLVDDVCGSDRRPQDLLSSSAQESRVELRSCFESSWCKVSFLLWQISTWFLLDVSVGYVVGSPGHLCTTEAEIVTPEGLNANIQPPTNMEKERLLERRAVFRNACVPACMWRECGMFPHA